MPEGSHKPLSPRRPDKPPRPTVNGFGDSGQIVRCFSCGSHSTPMQVTGRSKRDSGRSRPFENRSPPTILSATSHWYPNVMTDDDERLMRIALDEARRAGERGEVPIGAVLTVGDQVLAARGNEREGRQDPTAHAEILVVRDAAALLRRLAAASEPPCTSRSNPAPCAPARSCWPGRPRRLRRHRHQGRRRRFGRRRPGRPGIEPPSRRRAGLLAAESKEIMQRFFQKRRQGNGVGHQRGGAEPPEAPREDAT